MTDTEILIENFTYAHTDLFPDLGPEVKGSVGLTLNSESLRLPTSPESSQSRFKAKIAPFTKRPSLELRKYLFNSIVSPRLL